MLGINTCSDKVAAKAGDAFCSIKARVDGGIADIEAMLEKRKGLKQKNLEEGVKLDQEIAKDEANLEVLRNKRKAIDTLI